MTWAISLANIVNVTEVASDTMTPHVHTGVIAFLFAGVSAIVFVKLAKMGAAWAVGNPSTEAAGRWLGGMLD